MSDAHKGEKNHYYGKSLCDDHKQKISIAKLGKPLGDDHKQKLSDALKGDKNHNSKKVYQYEIDGTFVQSFASSGEAATHLNKNDGSLIRCCARGRCESAYSFKWSYTEM